MTQMQKRAPDEMKAVPVHAEGEMALFMKVDGLTRGLGAGLSRQLDLMLPGILEHAEKIARGKSSTVHLLFDTPASAEKAGALIGAKLGRESVGTVTRENDLLILSGPALAKRRYAKAGTIS